MENQSQLGVVPYKKDAYIIVEGKQNAGFFFIIQQGKVRISKEATVEGEKDDLLGPGDFFGVISTMSSHSHIESAQALTDVVLISKKRLLPKTSWRSWRAILSKRNLPRMT